MKSSRHFNPDHYLQTPNGRLFTEQRNAEAWQRLYRELRDALETTSSAGAVLYVVVGVQGSGKSTWVLRSLHTLGEHAVFLDAALPKATHRARSIAIAKDFGVRVVAVWIRTPLEVARSRNAARSPDERVPEEAIEAVNAMFEPPTRSEGFDEVLVVNEEESG